MTLSAGWGWPGNARKAHWFEEDHIISICNKWMWSGHREPVSAPSPDDCVVCTRRLALQAPRP